MSKGVTNPSKQAAELLGEPTEAGVWLSTEPIPWCTNVLGTGTFLDLVIVLLMSPFLLYEYVHPTKPKKRPVLGHTGDIYCARTANESAFIAAQ